MVLVKFLFSLKELFLNFSGVLVYPYIGLCAEAFRQGLCPAFLSLNMRVVLIVDLKFLNFYFNV